MNQNDGRDHAASIGALLAIASTLVLVGCAVTGAIKPVATSKSGFDGAFYAGETTVINDASAGAVEYRVFNQGSTSFVSLEANRENARERGMTFCAQQGRTLRPLRETLSTPPHVAGNYPRAELTFECVAKPAVSGGANVDEAKYAKLASLKKLLDDGALTKDEFEREKRKILQDL